MKRVLIFVLLISSGLNVLFFARRNQRIEKAKEMDTLFFCKVVSYEEGFSRFIDEMKTRFPSAVSDQAYFVCYRWDPLHYDYVHSEQIKVLDSIASADERANVEYVLVTEMEEEGIKDFLESDFPVHKNLKMLYGMDDFISGLCNTEGVFAPDKLSRPTGKTHGRSPKPAMLYAITDSKGAILYAGKNRALILKDTAFLNKLILLQ